MCHQETSLSRQDTHGQGCDATKGIPILGRVLESGTVEHFDYWTPEEGRRVPVRYPGLPDVFSLELTCDVPPFMKGQCLVFQPILPEKSATGTYAGDPERPGIVPRVPHQ